MKETIHGKPGMWPWPAWGLREQFKGLFLNTKYIPEHVFSLFFNLINISKHDFSAWNKAWEFRWRLRWREMVKCRLWGFHTLSSLSFPILITWQCCLSDFGMEQWWGAHISEYSRSAERLVKGGGWWGTVELERKEPFPQPLLGSEPFQTQICGHLMELVLSLPGLVEFQIFVLVLTAFLLDLSTSHAKSIYFVSGMLTVFPIRSSHISQHNIWVY